MAVNEHLLIVRNLKTHFFTPRGIVKAVDDVNFKIGKNEILGLAGESGSGKSVTALSIMRILPPTGRILEGEILLEGRNLVRVGDEEMRKIRGAGIAIVFQEATTSLNPTMKVGDQIAEAVILHQHKNESEARERAERMLQLVEIPDASLRVNSYPHELSGGMQQRIMIAMALSCNPKLLIADEATSSLDVTIQANILELIQKTARKLGSSVLLITHNMGIIAKMCDNVAVMYAGSVVEYGKTGDILQDPLHPYTKGLLSSVPRLGNRKKTLYYIRGTVPDMISPPIGCRFSPRCRLKISRCESIKPELKKVKRGRLVACHLFNH
jgi:oligopeptide/dipeptide ABC transporter ATP-binding protein